MDIVDCKCGERYWLNQQGWEASCDKCGRELKHSAIKVKQAPSSSPSSVGLEGLFAKHNDDLVWLIGQISFHNVTQKPLSEEDCQRAFKVLEILRMDLYAEKAD